MARGDGDRVIRCDLGHKHWGRHGAAGLLPVHRDESGAWVLLQQRAWWTPGAHGWGAFGGARDSHETVVEAALREAAEESTLSPAAVRPYGVMREDHGGWSYATVLAAIGGRPEVRPNSAETEDARWVPASDVDALADGGSGAMRLFPPFAASWPRIREGLRPPVLVVDAANVMGSRPDGWWRDRAGAAARLRDQLDGAALDFVAPFDTAFPEVVLVVEGQARGIGAGETSVRVAEAPGSGDDRIVEVASEHGAEVCVVVTADRELRARCEAVGATVVGPSTLLRAL